MSLEVEAAALRAAPLFRDAEPKTLELLAFLADVEDFLDGEALCHQGESGDCVFVILDGEAEVWVGSGAERNRVSVLGRHALVGEIAVLCDIPRTADVIARGPLTALRIDKEHLLQLLAETPPMALAVMRELADRLRATTQVLAALQSREAAKPR